MDDTLISLVWERARNCCEYCRIPQEFDSLTFEIDHIVAIVHGGRSIASNLCLSCLPCNRHKGTNLAGIDPSTGRRTLLFDPRRHSWKYHFRWEGARLLGRTAVGRTTVRVLSINSDDRIEWRTQLINEGVFPPVLE